MKKIVSVGKAMTLQLANAQVVYLLPFEKLEEFLKIEACEAILLNYFDDPENRHQQLMSDFPFFRIFRMNQFAAIDATLEEDADREKFSIEQRLDSLNQFSNGDLTRDLVAMFIKNFDFYSKEFDRNLKAKNADELCFQSHNLKSSSANLGAVKLRHVCQCIESASVEKDFEKLKIYVNIVLYEYVKCIEYLQKFVKPIL